MRTQKQFTVNAIQEFKTKLLLWSQQFEECVFLDSNEHQDSHSNYEIIIAVDAFTAIKTDSEDAFLKLDDYQRQTKDWLFGYLSYDLKNDIEKLTSINKDRLGFPELYFFQPKKIWFVKEQRVEAHYLKMVDDEIDADFNSILKATTFEKPCKRLEFTPKWTEAEYTFKAKQILDHIQRGDIYEVNFCQEFYAEDVQIKPISVYQNLNAISKAPFSCFLRLEEFYAMGSSPERFLSKQGHLLVSQPIKGTARRSDIKEEDERLKQELSIDSKEISENIMIVDLVRNDMSKTAQKASVNVEELCQIYTYTQVHQMISTITSKVRPGLSVAEILKSMFPMGSMTGAPKPSAMQIAELYESTKRGLYSGAIGYITPENDFDFNVVIRTLLYNAEKNYLSYMVGSALTAKAKPEDEYEECLLKGKALQNAVNATRVTKK